MSGGGSSRLAGALLGGLVLLAPPVDEGMVRIPEGTLLMGFDRGEPAERPGHRVTLSAFAIDRFETTNAEFAAFVAATGHVTDPQRSGAAWHWEGQWREVKGASWRQPHGPGSSILGLERHPAVQVSWNDARAYCRWRGKRLPNPWGLRSTLRHANAPDIGLSMVGFRCAR